MATITTVNLQSSNYSSYDSGRLCFAKYNGSWIKEIVINLEEYNDSYVSWDNDLGTPGSATGDTRRGSDGYVATYNTWAKFEHGSLDLTKKNTTYKGYKENYLGAATIWSNDGSYSKWMQDDIEPLSVNFSADLSSWSYYGTEKTRDGGTYSLSLSGNQENKWGTDMLSSATGASDSKMQEVDCTVTGTNAGTVATGFSGNSTIPWTRIGASTSDHHILKKDYTLRKEPYVGDVDATFNIGGNYKYNGGATISKTVKLKQPSVYVGLGFFDRNISYSNMGPWSNLINISPAYADSFYYGFHYHAFYNLYMGTTIEHFEQTTPPYGPMKLCLSAKLKSSEWDSVSQMKVTIDLTSKYGTNLFSTTSGLHTSVDITNFAPIPTDAKYYEATDEVDYWGYVDVLSDDYFGDTSWAYGTGVPDGQYNEGTATLVPNGLKVYGTTTKTITSTLGPS